LAADALSRSLGIGEFLSVFGNRSIKTLNVTKCRVHPAGGKALNM
jgi:hypothetical protein